MDNNRQEMAVRSGGPAQDSSPSLDAAYDEYCDRLLAGETLDPDEFCRNHPGITSRLMSLIQLHHRLDLSTHAIPKTPELDWPRPGGEFLQLKLVRLLGRGAFSRVFLATEPAVGHRRVAVKIAFRGSGEAQTLGRLDHPNIVPIYSVDEDPVTGLSAVCMPYQGRATLCDVLDRAFPRGPDVARSALPSRANIILDAAQDPFQASDGLAGELPAGVFRTGTYADGVAHLALQLAGALQLVHGRGIYHHDLKPSNVLLTPWGKPMLLDFNLSRDANLEECLLGGTLAYMAPEQLRAAGERGPESWKAVDARSDLFSLGVILYELLTGRHPFGRPSVKLSDEEARVQLLERQENGPMSATRGQPRVERDLARIVERCLTYDPAERFQSAAELAEALRKRSARRARASRIRIGFLAATAIALALAVAGISVAAIRTGERAGRLAEGKAAYHSGDYDRALRAFTRAIEADPNDGAAYFARGRVFQRMGKLDRALSEYVKADNLAGEGQIKACIGYCKSHLGLPGEALAFSSKAIEDGFGTAQAHNNLGYAYMSLARWKDARVHFDEAIRLDPSLQLAFYNRATLEWKLAVKGWSDKCNYYPQQGLADIEKALLLGPPRMELHHKAALLYGIAALQKKANQNISLGIDHLKAAIEQGLDFLRWKDDESLLALRSSPRFKQLVEMKTRNRRGLQAGYGLADPVSDRAE
jgi:tetratricopeptide (TPR) repeat protein